MFREKKMNWRPLLVMLALFTIGLFGKDVWMLTHHTYDLDRGIPFLGAGAVALLMAVVIGIKHHDEVGC